MKTNGTVNIERIQALRMNAARLVGLYATLCLIQIPAAIAGLHHYFYLWWPSVIMGLAIGSTPLLGTWLATTGAHTHWGWAAVTSWSVFGVLPAALLVLCIVGWHLTGGRSK